jgi:hypothetical protein
MKSVSRAKPFGESNPSARLGRHCSALIRRRVQVILNVHCTAIAIVRVLPAILLLVNIRLVRFPFIVGILVGFPTVFFLLVGFIRSAKDPVNVFGKVARPPLSRAFIPGYFRLRRNRAA